MADTPVPNGGAQAQPSPDQMPSLNALAQYAKDFSFENPNAPRSLAPQQQGPQINIQVNVNAKQLAETDFEVDLKLEGDGKIGTEVLFAFELTYAGVFRVRNMPAGSAPPGDHDRVPAAAVPVRPADGGGRGAQRRLPAALHRPDRFRGAVPPEGRRAEPGGARTAGAGGRWRNPGGVASAFPGRAAALTARNDGYSPMTT